MFISTVLIHIIALHIYNNIAKHNINFQVTSLLSNNNNMYYSILEIFLRVDPLCLNIFIIFFFFWCWGPIFRI
jgi:hypothetical protein